MEHLYKVIKDNNTYKIVKVIDDNNFEIIESNSLKYFFKLGAELGFDTLDIYIKYIYAKARAYNTFQDNAKDVIRFCIEQNIHLDSIIREATENPKTIKDIIYDSKSYQCLHTEKL